jgi:hypothetical protein
MSIWEQLKMAAFMQRYWADNQASGTRGSAFAH